ncbi:MAG: permease-like cell division protein FtsX [bacterium]|nr:permease-like cell division protein FtsX [bacterium]
MLVKTSRIFKFAFQNFWRNFWLSMVTVTIITLALLSVNFFILAQALLDTSLQTIEKKVNLSLYFKQSVQESDVQQLISKLQDSPQKPNVSFVSRDEALGKLKLRYEQEGNTSISESLTILEKNPLTTSLVIRAQKIEDYVPLQALLDEAPHKDWIEHKSFDDRKLLIQKIDTIKQNLRQIGIFAMLFFAVIASLIVYNTIRMTIYARQKEVAVMKLVGATNWFIRAPLIIESALYSVLAITITVAILYPLLGFIQPTVNLYFEGQAFDVLAYFSDNFNTIFGYQLLASVILNVISSSFAIGRYLKV